MSFSGKSTSVNFLFLDLYRYVEFQKKLTNRFREKLVTVEKLVNVEESRRKHNFHILLISTFEKHFVIFVVQIKFQHLLYFVVIKNQYNYMI